MRLRLPRRHGRVVTALVLTAIAVVVALYIATDGDPLGELFTPRMATAVRWANVVTGSAAFIGLMAIVTPRWSTYAPAFHDAIGTLLIYLFVAVAGAGQALSLGRPPNELAIAVLLANLGALRILHRAATGQYATLRSS